MVLDEGKLKERILKSEKLIIHLLYLINMMYNAFRHERFTLF